MNTDYKIKALRNVQCLLEEKSEDLNTDEKRFDAIAKEIVGAVKHGEKLVLLRKAVIDEFNRVVGCQPSDTVIEYVISGIVGCINTPYLTNFRDEHVKYGVRNMLRTALEGLDSKHS